MMCNIKEDIPEYVEVKSKANLYSTCLPEIEHPVDGTIQSMIDNYSSIKVKKENEYNDNDEFSTETLKQTSVSYINIKCKEEIKDEVQSEISSIYVTENQQNVEKFSVKSETDEKIGISEIVCHSSEEDSETQKAFTQRKSPDDNPWQKCREKTHCLTMSNSIDNKKSKMKNCQFCNRSYTVKRSLDDHLLREHKNKIETDVKLFITNKIHKCNVCSYETTNKHVLNMHISKHTKQKTNENCKFCNKSYNKKRSLDDHMLKHHKQEIKGDLKSLITSKIHTCNICNSYETTDKRDFDRHVNLIHNEVKIKMKCNFCTKSFIFKSSLDGHVLRKHKDKIKNNIKSFITYKIHVCKICNIYETAHKWNLDRHINLVHNEAKIKMQCQFCTESFSLKTSLDGHILRQHKDKIKDDIKSVITSNIYSCKTCSFESTAKNVLEYHVNSIHNKKMKLKCHFCDELFLFKYKLEDHLLNQHKSEIKGNMKKFIRSPMHTCKICNLYQTRDRACLKMHINSNCHLNDH